MNYDGMRDEKIGLLYRKSKGREEHWFVELHQRHHGRLIGWAQAYLPACDSEGAANAALADLHTFLLGKAPLENVQGWLTTRTKRNLINDLRRHKGRRYQRRAYRSIVAADYAASPDKEPCDVAIAREEAERTKSAWRRLTTPEQTLLHTLVHNGASHSEAAEQLGLPIGTVKTRCRAVLAKLRAELA